MPLLDALGLDGLAYEIKKIWRKPRQAALQGLNLACIVLSAFVLWRLLMVVTNCESPVVVVLSGSMEPGMYRGDILLLNRPAILNAGDIVVYKVPGRDIPIVHRILSIHEPHSGDPWLLTKGDNNYVDDRGLYANNELWLKQSHVMGKALGIAPKVGMLTIWLNDYPALKYFVLGLLGILLMLGKDV